MRNLQLDGPLVCFDLETTGTDPARDRIVQIALIRLEPDGSRRTYQTLINPGIPIPSGATAVHGITDQDVAGQPTLEQASDHIVEMLSGADTLGFNSLQFDVPLLAAELRRVGVVLDLDNRRHLDAMQIFHKKERRDLAAAYRFYCGQELQEAHSALADASATLEILNAQLARYDDLPRTTMGLHEFCHQSLEHYIDDLGKFVWNEAGEPAFGFGKFRGRRLADVAATDPGYLDWMAGSDFSAEVKRIAREARRGKFPTRT